MDNHKKNEKPTTEDFSNGDFESTRCRTDRDTIRRHLSEISKCAAAGFAGVDKPGHLQISALSPDRIMSSQRFLITDIDSMVNVAIAQSESGQNSYIELRTLRSDASRAGRGKKEHTAGVFGFTIDDDKDKGKSGFFGLPPSLVVATSPGNSHRTYFLQKAIGPTEADKIGTLLKSVAGGDGDTGVITQPYRIAGTVNYPNATKRAKGRIPCDTSITSIGPSYDPDELKSALLAELSKRGQEPPKASGSHPDMDFTSTDETAAELLQRNWWSADLEAELSREYAENRSNEFHLLIWRLKRDGYNCAEIAVLFRAYPDSCWMAKFGNRLEQEIQRSWHKISYQASSEQETPNQNSESRNSEDDEWNNKTYAEQPSSDDQSESKADYWTMGVDGLPKAEKSLIDGLIPARGFVFVAGQSGAGKTFVLGQMALCIATRRPFLGHEVRQSGAVIYVAAEGPSTIPPRLHAARIGENLPEQPYPIFVLSKDLGDLSSTTDRKKVIERIKSMNDVSLAKFGMPVRSVFLDTMAAAFSLRDESSSADASRVCKAASELGDSIGAVTIVAHHYGKTADSGLRGSSAFRAAADSVLSIQADRNELDGKCKNRCLVLTKSRTGPEGVSHAFDLKEVIVDYDDFEPILSAHIVAGHNTKNASKPKSMSVSLRRLKSALEEARLDFGYERRVFPDGPILKVVDQKHVRRIFYANTPADGDPQKIADTRRQAFRRALNDAERVGLAKCYDTGDAQLMWLLQD